MLKLIIFYLSLSLFSLLNAEQFNKVIPSDGADILMLVNTAILKTDDIITISLSQEKIYTIEKTKLSRRSADNYTWFGKDIHNSANSVIITVMGKKTLVKFTIDGVKYFLRQQDDNTFILKQKHSDAILKPFLNDIKTMTDADTHTDSPSRLSRTLSKTIINENDPVTLKILVLYTQKMLDFYGDDLNVTVQQMLDVANEAYSNSDTFVTLTLADIQLLDSTYTSESYTIETALNQLNTDTSLEIDKKRKLSGANFVSLLRRYESASSCGLAWLLDNIEIKNSSYPYSVVEVRSSDEGFGYYCSEQTLIHEIGHNMGCAHDRDHTSVPGLFDYSYGFDLAGTFATIMSYDSPQINYFSNPSLTYNTSVIGSAEENADAADCAKTIRLSKSYIANNLEFKEELESGDEQINYDINGSLFEQADRDSYDVTLNGVTIFNLTNQYYSNFSMFLNIYDVNGILITSTDAQSNTFTHTFAEATYTLVVSFYDDVNTGSLYNFNIPGNAYNISVSTQALTPVEVNEPLLLSVTPVDQLIEASASSGTVVATSLASDEDGSSITFSISDTINYTIDTNTGTVTLTAAGAAIVNAGNNLPDFIVSAQSTTGETSANSLSVNPADTTTIVHQIFSVQEGWQLVGAVDDVSNMSIFNQTCINVLWLYDTNKATEWSVYLPTDKAITHNYTEITEIKTGMGFWINGAAASGSCIIEN